MTRFSILLLALLLQGCFVEVDPGDVTNDKTDTTDDNEQEAGELITSLTVLKGDTPDGDFPLAVRVTMRGAVASQYELRLNGELLESGNMPATAIVTGPFSGQDTNDNYRLTYVTLGQAGDNEIELTLTKEGVSEKRAITVNLGNQCSGENENWFAANVQSSFNGCTDCHTDVPDNSSFAALKTWDKIQNSSDLYYVAHAPANFDTMPEANGGNYSHSDGRKWQPNSSEHLRVIEMLYRMDADFTCP